MGRHSDGAFCSEFEKVTPGLPRRRVSSRDNREREAVRMVNLAVEEDDTVVVAVLFPGIVAVGEDAERHEERVKEMPGRCVRVNHKSPCHSDSFHAMLIMSIDHRG